eukprot:gene6897-7591_t
MDETTASPRQRRDSLRRATVLGQVRVLVIKNLLVKRRWRKQTIFEILFPVYMSAVICLINLAAQRSDFPAENWHPPSNLSADVAVGSFAYVSNSHEQEFLINQTLKVLQTKGIDPKPQRFQNESELESWYLENPDNLWAALVMPETESNGILNYTIRMQADASTTSSAIASVPSASTRITDYDDCRNDTSCPSELYRKSGFLLLQYTIQEAYYMIKKSRKSILPSLHIVAMPMPPVSSDRNAGIRVAAVILTIMAFSPIIQYLLTNIVNEKERGIKDALFLMGMNPFSYWLSWLITYLLLLVIPCLLVTIIASTAGVLQHSSFFATFIVLYVYSVSLTALACVFAPFFSNSK